MGMLLKGQIIKPRCKQIKPDNRLVRMALAKLLTSDGILIRSSKWEDRFSFTMHLIIA